MPWLAVGKDYWFEGPAGRASLAGLFEGRRQLIVYRAFYGPEVTTYAEGGSYPERACVGCSLGADQVAHPGAPARAGHDARVRLPRPAGRDPAPEGAPRVGNTSPGTRSPTTSTRTSTSTSGTAPTPSSARATGSSAPTSSTTAATSRWAAPGTTSTSPRSAARRSGRTRRRATRRPRRTSGGTTTYVHDAASHRMPGLLSVAKVQVLPFQCSTRHSVAPFWQAIPVVSHGSPGCPEKRYKP